MNCGVKTAFGQESFRLIPLTHFSLLVEGGIFSPSTSRGEGSGVRISYCIFIRNPVLSISIIRVSMRRAISGLVFSATAFARSK